MGTGEGEGGLGGIKAVAEDPRPCCWLGEVRPGDGGWRSGRALPQSGGG